MKSFIIALSITLVVVLGIGLGIRYVYPSQPEPPKFNSAYGKIYVDLRTFQDSVEFTNYAKDLTDESDIDMLVFDIALQAKYTCSRPLTFKATECTIRQEEERGDTLSVYLTFTGENGYGVSAEMTGVADWIDGELFNFIAF